LLARRGYVMQVYWERLGILGPIYRLLGAGLSNHDISKQLNVTDSTIDSCVAWLLVFLNYTNRSDLVVRASSIAQEA
jgi:DNA-binding NarL/FixJ family response regulator